MSAAKMGQGVLPERVKQMFDAITVGDMTAMKNCFSNDASIWHGVTKASVTVDQAAEVLGSLSEISNSVSYQDQRVASIGNEMFVQHRLCADLKSGKKLDLPAMMYIVVNDEGLVTNIEEYYDSRATDCLVE